jgi:hypothetical protein
VTICLACSGLEGAAGRRASFLRVLCQRSGELGFQVIDFLSELLLSLGWPGAGRRLEDTGQVLKHLPLPLVEQAGLELMLVAQVRDGHLVDQMPLQDGGLLLRSELTARPLGLFGHDNLPAVRNTADGPSCSKGSSTPALLDWLERVR